MVPRTTLVRERSCNESGRDGIVKDPLELIAISFVCFLELANLLRPSQPTGIAQCFWTSGTLRIRNIIQAVILKIRDLLTFLHSGESVRPQVLHTYCSVAYSFFYCPNVVNTIATQRSDHVPFCLA